MTDQLNESWGGGRMDLPPTKKPEHVHRFDTVIQWKTTQDYLDKYIRETKATKLICSNGDCLETREL